MFDIKTARKPNVSNFSKAHKAIIKQVSTLIDELVNAYQYDFHALYVRGSVPLGCAGKHSDIDIVVLLRNIKLKETLAFKNIIYAICSLYQFTIPLGIKVFSVGQDNRINSPTQGPDIIKNAIKKYVNFDVTMNGLCIKGQPIESASAIYNNPEEFININRFIWENEIIELVEKISKKTQRLQSDGPVLAKKILRLLAYNNFTKQSLYLAAVIDSVRQAKKHYPPLTTELDCLYQLYCQNLNIRDQKIEKQVREAINRVNQFLAIKQVRHL